MRALVLLLLILTPVAMWADEGRTVDDVDQPHPERREFGGIPLVGGDSDVGVALGALGSVASFAPHARPYLWRTELQAMISFKHDKAGWNNPYQDYYVQFGIPSLAHNQLRLNFRLAYTQYNALKYYGLGDASTVDLSWQNAPSDSTQYIAGKQYNQYKIAYPHATAEAQFTLARPFYMRVVLDYQYNEVTVNPGSKADEDLSTGQIVGGGNFGVGLLGVSLWYDTRDNEMSTNSGMQHNIGVRLSPGGLKYMPYRYGGANATVRFFFPIVRDHVVVALRLVGDLLMGDVPFASLAESADGYALGGGKGVRGIPAQRYYGKLKTYGNFETRFEFPSFTAFDQEAVIGVVAFLDGGRLWADVRPDALLDGKGVGLKYGIGGGIRFRLGQTFLLRGDAAWSPDADPVGFYFNVGEVF